MSFYASPPVYSVHYCAEQFSNDNSLSSSMMKALKRVMAGEYSRELSAKVHEGSKRVCIAGFRIGGTPGYGLRRLLVSASREPKCILSEHERKSLQSDHVILVPGPDHEVRCVRDIFRMFTQEEKLPSAIAAGLRKKGIAYTGAKRTAWYGAAVSRLLKNPKYCGCSVFGQSTFRLHMQRARNPRIAWTITADAWQPLVDQCTFDRAQKRFENLTNHRTDAELLSGLRRLLDDQGTLSEKLLNQASSLPSIEPYARRFGSLSEAFERVGYIGSKLGSTRTRRTVRALRDQVVSRIVAIDPSGIAVIQPDAHFRPRLQVSGSLVSIFVCCSREEGTGLKWILNPVRHERSCIALIVRLNVENQSVMDLHVVPDTTGQVRYLLDIEDPWLRRGQKLSSIEDFVSVVQIVSADRASAATIHRYQRNNVQFEQARGSSSRGDFTCTQRQSKRVGGHGV